MAALTGSSCVPFTRHHSSRQSYIKRLQSQHSTWLSLALRPITLLSNNIYAHFKSSCYTSRAMNRSFSARGRWMQSVSLPQRVWLVELYQIICWKGDNFFPSNSPQPLWERSELPVLLKHSLLLPRWPFPLVCLKIQEKWIILLLEQNNCLFFLHRNMVFCLLCFIFVNLAWSVPITWHFFPPCPKRVASTMLLVFMYVNRFQTLHSKVFSACNYSAFWGFFGCFFPIFSVFLLNLPLCLLKYCRETCFALS